MTMKKPKYVVQIKRRNKTDTWTEWFFKVPARLRPEDWPASIRLPTDPRLRSRQESAEQSEAIFTDGNRLNRELAESRSNGLTEGPGKGTLPWLMDQWINSDDWPEKQNTQRLYLEGWKRLNIWSEKNNHAHVKHLSWPPIFKLITGFEGTPGIQKIVRVVLKRLLQMAADQGLITVSPFVGNDDMRRWAKPKSDYKVQIWDIEKVRYAVRLCDDAGKSSIGTAIMIGFDLMQYPSQISLLQRGRHYDPKTGAFDFERNKTGERVHAKATGDLVKRLELTKDQMYLVISEHTGRPYNRASMTAAFRYIMKGHEGMEDFQMRWLRHSGVFEARRAGLSDKDIATIGGWKSTGAIQHVLNTNYFVKDDERADQGQDAREMLRNEGLG